MGLYRATINYWKYSDLDRINTIANRNDGRLINENPCAKTRTYEFRGQSVMNNFFSEISDERLGDALQIKNTAAEERFKKRLRLTPSLVPRKRNK